MPKAKKIRNQSKCWAFTIYEVDKPLNFDGQVMDYLIYSLEAGDETHRDHFQGYVRFKTRKEMTGVQRALGVPDCHVEVAIGTEEHNHDYCTKDHTHKAGPWEHGVYDPQANTAGRRTDLEHAAAQIISGASLRDVAKAYPTDFLRYSSGFMKLQEMFAPRPPPSRDVQVMVMWGPTGVGKSHRVMTNVELTQLGIICSGLDGYSHPFDKWDSDSKVLFIDEFSWRNWSILLLNKVLDKWTFNMSCRYQDKYATWEHVIICSNEDPLTWYPDEPRSKVDALRRRLGHGCRHVQSRDQDISNSPPVPDFDPDTGKKIEH